MGKEHTYIAIDLKSFYASVECVERGFDPLTTNLVVADISRTEKTICLAVSPSLKEYGISGRARLFEVIHRVKEVNRERLLYGIRNGYIKKDEKGEHHFASSSFYAPELKSDPTLELSYYIAPPRMKIYEEYSTKIYSIYLKYIAPEDIHVYSIDEVLMDVTAYLGIYKKSAHELAMTMIRDVLESTGITATAGIGTNLYLCKVAMDIVAKHVPADKDGVRIAELDEMIYRELLWCHRPLTDFWRIGRGISKKLESLGLYTMGDVAQASLVPVQEEQLYRTFGVNAELLIDHAWGWEPATMAAIKEYRPATNSLSSGQVLKEPYDYGKGRLIVKEMTELMSLDLVRKGVVTKRMVLDISYDKTSLFKDASGKYYVTSTGKPYMGEVTPDRYGRPCPKSAHGTAGIDRYTSSSRRIIDAVMGLYTRIVNKDMYIRYVSIAACDLLNEEEVPEDGPVQLDLFTDYDAIEKKKAEEKAIDEKEKRIQQATLFLQGKFGKNAVLKGMNLQEGATTIERNVQVGGHRAE